MGILWYEINPQLPTHGLEAQWGSGISQDSILKPDFLDMIMGFKVLDIRERMLDAPNPTHVYRRLVIEAIELLRR
jgi:hypothetical protein